MGNVTVNFKQEEFKCKCGCGEMNISNTIPLLCQLVRDKFRQPVTVVSGCRCEKHNTNVGGAKNSQHKPDDEGMCHAVDLKVKGVEPKIVYEFIDGLFPNSLGLGVYKSWVHIDDRIDRAYRWKG
jgi:uncharacterized protein YcbK (DUF882 family)